MLQWETVDPNASYPIERYRAVSGNREYRVFHGPEAASQALPWILVVREVRGEWRGHGHHGTYRTDVEAEQAAEQWEGPPPQKG